MSGGGTILLVGAGKMGSAMLAGWLKQGVAGDRLHILEPNPSDLLRSQSEKTGVTLNPDPDALGNLSAVVLAVKPQVMDEVAGALTLPEGSAPVFLSIAAGRTLDSFAGHFGNRAAIVRAMPNTPAAIGRGVTVVCANNNVGAAQRALCEDLLKAVGKVAWVTNEADMDAVTAVSGSGPAYVFLLAETLAAAGRQQGLSEEMAELLAVETVAGAGALLKQSDESAAELRQNVTSPGGTTAAALDVLQDSPGMAELLDKAVAAATRRSRELAS